MDGLPGDLSWDEMIQRICDAPMEENWVAGERGGYSTTAAWYVLGEMIRRVSGVEVDRVCARGDFGADRDE